MSNIDLITVGSVSLILASFIKNDFKGVWKKVPGEIPHFFIVSGLFLILSGIFNFYSFNLLSLSTLFQNIGVLSLLFGVVSMMVLGLNASFAWSNILNYCDSFHYSCLRDSLTIVGIRQKPFGYRFFISMLLIVSISFILTYK